MVMMVYLALHARVESSADVVKTMSINFSEALDVCKKEVGLFNYLILLIYFCFMC